VTDSEVNRRRFNESSFISAVVPAVGSMASIEQDSAV
jgi:hypothetical protein